MRKSRSRPLSNHTRRVRGETTMLLRQLGLEAVGAYHRQRGLCFWCKEPWGRGAEVDHHLPISKGGLGVIENLRVLCNLCNRMKSTRHPDEFRTFLRARRAPSPPPLPATLSRLSQGLHAIGVAQGWRCWWCPARLRHQWHVASSGKGVCDRCHLRYHRLTDAEASSLASQDLI
jgi:5-methylcytosine-specific restriction endonuclease McrA